MTASWTRNPRPRKFVRDYHRQRYGNPLFPRLMSSRPSRPTMRRSGRGAGVPKAAIALATLGILAAFGLWYAIWSPALHVTDVVIEGASVSTEETVRKAVDGYAAGHAMLIFPRGNVLLFSESGAREAIEAAVFLDGVDIRKKLPGTVTVTVREKTIKAAMELGGRLHGLDESGFVVRELAGKEVALMHDLPPGFNMVGVEGLGAESMEVPAPKDPNVDPAKDAEAKAKALKESRNAWPLIIDKRTPDPKKDRRKPGTQAFSAATVGLVLQANARLPDVAGEAVRWFIPDEAADSVDAIMAGEWHVYLATATPLDVQAERLGLVLKEKIGARKAELEYVDLRYNERIFYRLKDAPKP